MKKFGNILLIILGASLWMLLSISIITIADMTFVKIINILNIVFVILYAAMLFAMPHGNLLKYCMLLMSLSLIVSSILYLAEGKGPTVSAILYAISALVMAYCSGRLNKIKENKMLLGSAWLILLGSAMVFMFESGLELTFKYVITCLTYPILFSTILVSYLVRFDDHKKAGIESDKAIEEENAK